MLFGTMSRTEAAFRATIESDLGPVLRGEAEHGQCRTGRQDPESMVSVVSYIQGNLRVKAATVGRNLGSREFDLALANKLGEQFAFAEKFKAWPRPTSTPSASPTTRTSTTPCPSST